MIPESAIQKFKDSLRGQFLLPSDPGYDIARAIPNAMIDRRPAVIVRCAGAADVVASVRFAREHDLLSRFAAEATALPGSRFVKVVSWLISRP